MVRVRVIGVKAAEDQITMNSMSLVDWIRMGTEQLVQRGPECPGDNQLAAFVDGLAAPQDRARLRDHLADCDHCLRAGAFLSRNAEAETLVAVPPSLVAAARGSRFSRAPASRARLARRWAAAAALVAMSAVVTWELDPGARLGDQARVRGRATPALPSPLAVRAAGPGPQVVFPPAGATIAATSVDFRWTEIATAVSYEVRVVTLDGDVVWNSRVFGTEAALPAGVPLYPGEPYLVRISANLAGGKTLDSGHIRFFVRKP